MRLFGTIVCVALAALCCIAPRAHATVVIAGTRVILPAQQGEVTLRLSNKGAQPALVEAWIDTGNPQSTPESSTAPFLITPPIFRIDAGKDQSLRILFTGAAGSVPADRESLFWLNVLEVPPKPTGPAADQNRIQFAIRSRLKLFYRPGDLPGGAMAAPRQLTFRAAGYAPAVALAVHNPTPYYITISGLALGGTATPVAGAEGMVAPFSNLTLPLAGIHRAPAPGTAIRYTTINDYGAADVHQGTVGP